MTRESCKRGHGWPADLVEALKRGAVSRARVAVSIVFLMLLGLPAPAGGSEPRAAGVLSTGTTGGNGLPGATYRGASADGTRVYFQPSESLVSGDTDASIDLYERAAAV